MVSYGGIEIPDDFSERLSQLHGQKSIHPVEDFPKVIEWHLDLFSASLKHNYLAPCQEMSQDIAAALQKLRTQLNAAVYSIHGGNHKSGCVRIAAGYNFHFHPNSSEIETMLHVVNTFLPQLEEKSSLYGYLEECLMRHIQLDLLPNKIFDDRKVYLKSGHLIFPHVGAYLVYDIFTCPKGVVFKPVIRYGCRTLDEALKDYVDHSLIGSIVIAKNTDYYPLEETVLPILKKKYEAELGLWR